MYLNSFYFSYAGVMSSNQYGIKYNIEDPKEIQTSNVYLQNNHIIYCNVLR